MIKTPLSTMIGGAFWTPCTTIIGSTSATFNTIIKSLFANNEQGFAYDPNDLTTLYQDAAGTIPVTAAGQPVGLVLDKSKGLVLGDEKWIDSSVIFSGLSSRISPNIYRVYSSDGAYSAMNINTALVSGRLYKLIFNVDSITTLGGGITVEGNPATIFNTVGRKEVLFFATSTIASIKRTSTACDIQISNVSVKELSGNHAYQSVSASRPLLQRNATTGAYYLAFDGVDDFLQTNNIDFTATDKVSLFTGIRKLTDANVGAIAEFSGNVNSNTGSFWLLTPLSVGANTVSFASRGSAATVASIAALSAPTSAVLRGVGDISGDNASTYVNGKLGDKRNTDQGTGNYGNYPLYIGRRAGTSLPFNGHLYSLIGIGRLTSASETIALEKAIAKQTGVTLNV